MDIDPSLEPPAGEVLVSYSWDNEEHVRWALQLSDRLRADGIDAILDQYEVSPPEGWPKWMDRKVRDARLVLVVCTETYYKRVMGEEVEGKGLGVRWESALTYQHIYNAGSTNVKFIPVLRKQEDSRFIPTPLQGATNYVVDTTGGYQRLYSRLLGRGAAEKPPLGKVRRQPERQVKTDPTMYVSIPIDVDLWNRAKWRGTFFLWNFKDPPYLGLAFEHGASGKRIFQQWHQRYGREDRFDELRISIVEGDVAGEMAGYSVHIGVEHDNLIKRYREAGLHVGDNDFFATVSRIHRMNPPPTSQNLATFQSEYRRFGSYKLIPGACKPDGSNLKYSLGLSIVKRKVHFRDVKDVSRENDVDSVILDIGDSKKNS